MESVPDILNPPNGWAPTIAPVHLRLKYRLPTKNCSRALREMVGVVGEDGAGQAVLRVVGESRARRRNRCALVTASTGPKISSWKIRALRIDVGDDGRRDEVAVAVGGRVAAGDQAAFLLARLDVLQDRASCAPALITGPM